jgi:hypothetical protein
MPYVATFLCSDQAVDSCGNCGSCGDLHGEGVHSASGRTARPVFCVQCASVSYLGQAVSGQTALLTVDRCADFNTSCEK